MLPISLRTAEMEQRYQDAIASGELKDIAKIEPIAKIGYTNILSNSFPYDLPYRNGDMTIGDTREDWMVWWVNVGIAIQEGKFNDYDVFHYNIGKRQSQPHVPHGHLLNFDRNNIEVLRTLYTSWKENNN